MTTFNLENYLPLPMQAWERPLLTRALEAAQDLRGAPDIDAGPNQLQASYKYCEKVTAKHSRSFYMASQLLPLEKRRAVRALYAFCRITDDIVDEDVLTAQPVAKMEQLRLWRTVALADQPPADNLVALAWADTRRRYNIPQRYAEQLIEGVAQDLQPARFETFAQLAAYSYSVASTVGLMSMHIIGYSTTHAIQYAIRLGVALQITNILRDVGEDWQKKRVYLPLGELKQFGIRPTDLANGHVSTAWREFMRFQIERNRRIYKTAMPGIGYLHADGRMSITAAAELYAGILRAIEANDYDVFRRRAYLSFWQKLALIPGIWWRSKRLSPGKSEKLDR